MGSSTCDFKHVMEIKHINNPETQYTQERTDLSCVKIEYAAHYANFHHIYNERVVADYLHVIRPDILDYINA